MKAHLTEHYAALHARLASELARHERQGYALGVAVIQRLLSLVCQAQGDLRQALTHAQIALSLFESLGETARVENVRELIARWEAELQPFKLTLFEFDTVTLDERGKVKERRTLTANQFIEELAPDLTLEMVEIPGGTFTMGTSEADAKDARKEIQRYYKDGGDWVKDEMPQHEVTVSPFYLGKFTITQAQWREVASWPQVERELKAEPSYCPKDKRRKESDDQRPVEQISWEDAQEFCARLSAKTGRAYRLPTEAEWEYACRAGTTTPFAFGPTIAPEFVNYDSEYPYAQTPKSKPRNETVAVGTLGVANPFGLYDMHGNVWEWCQDWFSDNYYDECKKQGVAVDPTGPEDGQSRVLRGGSWINLSDVCRSACRLDDGPGYRYYGVGVRVVVSARTLGHSAL
ncbi:MAG: SUMF1/EgtB/PvdO family nonheme iron enzyme [Acidobacteria bacterium]|nr:SUMF1/EgtB/PvdO family nonheme iron enzyme [Acidobacteriota bacterium]